MHRHRPEQRIPGFLEHHRLPDVRQPQTAIFHPHMWRHQSLRGGQSNEFTAEFLGGTVMRLAAVALQRNDLIVDESTSALLQLLQFRRKGKVPSAILRYRDTPGYN